MSERPFLLFVTRDEEGRHVIKVQGDGLPLTERRITVAECLRYVKQFAEAAIEMTRADAQDQQNRGSEGMNS
jgi:hypothetical protein